MPSGQASGRQPSRLTWAGRPAPWAPSGQSPEPGIRGSECRRAGGRRGGDLGLVPGPGDTGNESHPRERTPAGEPWDSGRALSLAILQWAPRCHVMRPGSRWTEDFYLLTTPKHLALRTMPCLGGGVWLRQGILSRKSEPTARIQHMPNRAWRGGSSRKSF